MTQKAKGQSEYILEDSEYVLQISRFNADGNRILTIRIESFDEIAEANYLLSLLNADAANHLSPDKQ